MFNRFKHNRRQIIYTVFTVILLCAVIFTMIGYIHSFSEKEAFNQLALETQQIKNDINLQIHCDRGNLSIMSNFASKLYSDGESFDLMFQSYEKMGLIENIGILLPDNTFITKVGSIDAGEALSFDEEVQKGEYISGIVGDVTNSEREVIRVAVPIDVDGETVAILYGAIELKTLEEKYGADARKLNAELYLLEGTSGKFIVDTKHTNLGNVTALASIPYKDSFSYADMIRELSAGIPGYTAFQSQTTEEYIYVNYAPFGLGDWQIMLSKPEQVVFAGARATGNFLAKMLFTVVLIMLVYLLVTVASAKRKARVTAFSSTIRKRLLELSIQFDSVQEALKDLTTFANSRSAFFVDTFGEDHNNIIPSQETKLLTGEDRAYFIQTLISHVSQKKKTPGASVQTVNLIADKKFMREMPEFHRFLKINGINSVNFAVVEDNSNNVSLIGVINPKNDLTDVLLKEIAVCFSMAIYNKKHLTKTEAMALTDSLTGLANRMSYKQDMKILSGKKFESLACIYIDANELHYFNNKYGHAAGDQMLVYISEVLVSEFPDSYVYRMGGDEFLIFTQNISRDIIERRLSDVSSQIKEMKYSVSIGIKYLEGTIEIEELVKHAEKEMYKNKAKYYQDKELSKVPGVSSRTVETISTGIKEVDACLSIMSVRYSGAYCVSLKTDKAFKVLAPAYYFSLDSDSHLFSEFIRTYIYDFVKPEFHRTMLKFLDYEVLEKQLRSGHNPKVSYTKIDGEMIVMSIHATSQPDDETMDTVWIFEKKDI